MTKMQSSPEAIQSINTTEDREVKNYWFDRLYKKLFTKAHFILNNHQDAEDTVHDFYLKLFSWPIHRFQEKTPEEIEAYIVKAFYNHCKDAYRKRKKIAFEPDSLEKELLNQEQIKNYEQELIEEERINGLLNLLTPEQLDVVLLWIQGFSHQEIADNLKITSTVSTSRLSRALKKLREYLPE